MKRMKKKCKKIGISMPNTKALWRHLQMHKQEGFLCQYCGREMKVFDPTDHYCKNWTLDHRTSLYNHGDNTITNIAFVCQRCNVLKGTMKEETFREFLWRLNYDHDFLDKLYIETFICKMAEQTHNGDQYGENES